MDDLQKSAIRALSEYDQLIESMESGDEAAVERSRATLLELVQTSSPVQLRILFLGYKVAVEKIARGED